MVNVKQVIMTVGRFRAYGPMRIQQWYHLQKKSMVTSQILSNFPSCKHNTSLLSQPQNKKPYKGKGLKHSYFNCRLLYCQMTNLPDYSR